jgi:uncharacterized MAPEG superfamily protein
MTTELFYLVLTALLTATLWVPYVIGVVRARGALRPQDYVTAPSAPLPDWVNRANRAHQNAVESFGPFAAVVLVGHAMGVSTALTVWCATIFFFARLAHAIVHIAGVSVAMARTVIFTVAWGAFAAFAVSLLLHTK